MKVVRYGYIGLALVALMLGSGCSTKKLEEENSALQARVSELEQLEADYSDKLAAAETMSAEDKERHRQEIERIRSELNRQLDEQIRENKALIQKLESLTIVTLGEANLFGSGLAELTPEGAKTIRKIAEALSQYSGYHIRVEGHTDSMPIGHDFKSVYPSNWELSTARATNVVRYMIHALEVDPQRLSATGYAQHRPVSENVTKEGRAKNRRIRIVVFKEM